MLCGSSVVGVVTKFLFEFCVINLEPFQGFWGHILHTQLGLILLSGDQLTTRLL